MRAVILAAGRGTRLEPITKDIPKCLVPVGGVPLVDRMIERLAEVDIEEVIVVSGHRSDVLAKHLAESADPLTRSTQLVFNDRFAEWGNFYSLLVAESALAGDDFIKIDGDVLLGKEVLPALLAAGGAAVLSVDRGVDLGSEEMKARVDHTGQVVELNKRMDPAVALGESIGVERIGSTLAPVLFGELRQMITDGETDEYYERTYERLMQDGVPFSYADITKCIWCEIDDAHDLERANAIVAGG